MISPSEVRYITDGVRQGIRIDGRTPDAIRKFKLDMGAIPSANGSARIQSKGCDIYIGVKCEIGKPESIKPEVGIAKVAVEFGCSALVSTQALMSRQANLEAEAFGDHISRHIEMMCLSTLDMRQFSIEKGVACWILSIDILVERFDGPLIDPISIGVRAALMDLELPAVAIPAPHKGGEDSESHIPRVDLLGTLWHPKPNSSICISVGVYCDNSMILVDLDKHEEWLAKSKDSCLVLVAVDDLGRCSGIHKHGIGSIDPRILSNVVSAAAQVGKRIANAMTHHRQ